MKRFLILFFSLMLALSISLMLPGRVMAADRFEVVFGGTFSLEDGETLDEDLIVIGGTAVLEEGSRVNGNIFLIGGSLNVSGLVKGNITATGGYMRLNASAVVEGDVTTAGADIDQDADAQVLGEVITGEGGPFRFTFPGRFPLVRVSFTPLWQAVSFFARIFIFSALAVLLAMFFPSQMDRMDKAMISQPIISGGLGLFTLIVAPLMAVLLAITLILIPVSLLGLLLLVIMAVFGWVTLGLEIGKRMGLAIRQDWTPPLAAGVGTFFLTLVVGSLSYIGCVGWVFPLVTISLGLGAVLLTRFGTQTYPAPLPAGTGNETISEQPPAASSPSSGQASGTPQE